MGLKVFLLNVLGVVMYPPDRVPAQRNHNQAGEQDQRPNALNSINRPIHCFSPLFLSPGKDFADQLWVCQVNVVAAMLRLEVCAVQRIGQMLTHQILLLRLALLRYDVLRNKREFIAFLYQLSKPQLDA